MSRLVKGLVGSLGVGALVLSLSVQNDVPWTVSAKEFVPQHVEADYDILLFGDVAIPFPNNELIAVLEQYFLVIGRKETINIKGLPIPYNNSRIINVSQEVYNSSSLGDIHSED